MDPLLGIENTAIQFPNEMTDRQVAIYLIQDSNGSVVPFDVHPVRWPSRYRSMVRQFDMPTNDRRRARHIFDKHYVRRGPKKNFPFVPFVLV